MIRTCGWDISAPATKHQRQALHRWFAHMVAHPEEVAWISQDEADEILKVCKKLCDVCKNEEGIEPQPT